MEFIQVYKKMRNLMNMDGFPKYIAKLKKARAE